MWKNATNVTEIFWLWGIDIEEKTTIHVFMFEESISILEILRDADNSSQKLSLTVDVKDTNFYRRIYDKLSTF